MKSNYYKAYFEITAALIGFLGAVIVIVYTYSLIAGFQFDKSYILLIFVMLFPIFLGLCFVYAAYGVLWRFSKKSVKNCIDVIAFILVGTLLSTKNRLITANDPYEETALFFIGLCFVYFVYIFHVRVLAKNCFYSATGFLGHVFTVSNKVQGGLIND